MKSNILEREYIAINQRYNRINFLLKNDKNRLETEIQKVVALNKKLKKEEERIRVVAERMHITLEKQKLEKMFDDYNFGVRLSLLSFKKNCNKRHKVDFGDPFYEDETYSMFKHFTNESFYSKDWNVWKNHFPEPYSSDSMCYTMH